MNNPKLLKKTLTVLLTLVTVLGAFAIGTQAAEDDKYVFGYNSSIIAEATDEGVDFKNKSDNTVVRSVKIGDGETIEIDKINTTGSAINPINGEDFYNKIVAPKDGGSFFITFTVKPTDLTKYDTSADGKTLLSIEAGKNNHRIYLRARKNSDTSVSLVTKTNSGGTVEFSSTPILETDKTYNFVIEAETGITGVNSKDTTKFVRNFHIYLDGVYLGGSSHQIDAGPDAVYKMTFGASGKWELTNFRIFNPTEVHGTHDFVYSEHIEAVTTANGVEFKCAVDDTVVRTVDIGRGQLVTRKNLSSASVVKDFLNGVDFYGDVLKPEDGGSFFMSFDLKPADLSGFTANSGGATLLKFWAKNKDAHKIILRGYRVSNTAVRFTAKDNTGKDVELNDSPIMETGKTYSFLIEYNPSTSQYSIYMDGKYIGGSKIHLDYGESETYVIQMFDSGKWDMSNFKLYNPTHVHDTPVEDTVTERIEQGNNKLSLITEYSCGETISQGICEAIKEEITPVYGITDETVIIPKFEAPEKDFWLLGEISAMELPEESKSIVAIGDGVLLGITPDGVLTVGDEETNAKLTVDNEYHKLAFRFDTTLKKYTVYLDNSVVAESEYTAVGGDVKVAAAGAGKYHFDRAAVVALSKEGNMAYKLAEGAHTHHYDPETSSLEFNAERSSITINYTCVECDRPAFDGISENLYDADNAQMILPVFGTEEKVVEGELLTSAAPYWFSFDAVLKSELAQGRGSVFKFVDDENNEISILTMYTDGAFFEAEGNEIARLGKTKTNVTVNVIENEGEYSYRLYIDGIYCGEYAIELDSEKLYGIALGAEFATTLEATEIKFAKMANGGELEISTFACGDDAHVHVINANTRVEYLDVNAFSFTYRCARCGKTVTEQINKSFYEATPHVYTAQGALNAVASEEKGDSYWIIADVNVRGYIGSFRSFVPLISDGEVAALLINSEGELMLADGTKVYRALKSKSTYNVALKYEDGVYYLFLDGAYAGCTTGTSFKQGITDGSSNEYFGSPELNNIRYYNIKVVTTGVTDEPVRVQFIEDASVLPCVHSHHSFLDVVITLGEQIKEVYICDKCGERVVRVNDISCLDHTLNDTNKTVSEGSFTTTKSISIYSSEEYMSRDATPYWVRFTVNFEKLPTADALNSGNGKNDGVDFFSTSSSGQFGFILRMFAHETSPYEYVDGVVDIRTGGSLGAKRIAVIKEGETHEFTIGIVPSSGLTSIYMDGKLVEKRSFTSYAVDRANYFFRFGSPAAAPGRYNVSGFEFVSAGKHEHTAAYAQYIEGGYDCLEYSDTTLTHRYTCYCGARIVEGIDKIYADEIVDIEKTSTSVSIPETIGVKVGRTPYWVSAKVYSGGSDTTVYSYKGNEIVGIENGVYVIGGNATAIPVSGVDVMGDYDLVSIKVDPVADIADVYINGFFAGACTSVEFEDIENFDISFGGTAELGFKFIKIVSLANGANEEVTVSDCGDHSFKRGRGIRAVITENGVEYTCKYCNGVIKAVEVGNGGIIVGENVDQSEPAAVEYIGDNDFYGNILSTANGESFFVTFTITPKELKDFTDAEGGSTLLKFQIGKNTHRIMLRAYKVDDKSVKIMCQDSAGTSYELIGIPTLSNGNSYKFVIEYDTSDMRYYIHMNGEYLGTNTFKINYGAGEDYKLYVGGSGIWNITGLKVFDPEIEEIKKIETEGGDGSEEPAPEACAHKAPACAEGVYSISCELCGQSVMPSHNYKTEADRTRTWTKYTCEDCGVFHIEFNNLSRLKGLKFRNENELLNCLTDEYCPVFKKAE